MTVILSGGYTEAGDRGRIRACPGDVLTHSSYESHVDLFTNAGAEVLVLPLHDCARLPLTGRIADPDVIVRTAEHDVAAASEYLAHHVQPGGTIEQDWPDRLVQDLWRTPDLELRAWAFAMGLKPESISRGFKRIYGLTPMAFRARVRTLRALRLIGTAEALADVWTQCGFSDHAHMTRNVRQLTGLSPTGWRRALLRLD